MADGFIGKLGRGKHWLLLMKEILNNKLVLLDQV